ncbi:MULTISPECIES: non-ribosomal peptide synthetase [Cyanophyceae]|uniref:non-ribosomal peptide synthetase n=1 Tax=Cyanophyceae TaxID=3028117 RepID=UPI0016845140|nr:non-ribosomal peptide synthetase [Trichocoleus sp. FACHB-40]MBD2002942.1 amino acid adenylation domain-containing protein [Trichocoleus sp. FACHB-40]
MQSVDTKMPDEIVEGYRLSPQQAHLWSLQQIDSSLPYRVQCTLLHHGLDKNILKSALQEVVNRHEILRTNFRSLSGMELPFQVITHSVTPSINYYDLSELPPATQDEKVEALFNETLGFPLNFEKDFLLHLSLISLSSNKYILLVSLPAMLADRVTLRNLVQEINDAYAVCLRGEKFSDEPLQYADIAEWQNELLEGEGELERAYWHQKDLSGLSNLKLSYENEISKNIEFQPQVLTAAIPPNLIAAIETLVGNDTSVSEFLLACWQVLLWRLIDYPDITVGTAYEGRKYEDLQQALGLFAKYLPIQTHLSENLPFSKVLELVDNSVNEGYKWQEYFTWQQQVNHLDTPFFPFTFEVEEFERDSNENKVFTINKEYACIERFKIKLSCIRRDDLIAEFHYDSNLFALEDIKRLSEQFVKLLESVTNNPDASIAQLEILSDRERQQLLVDFNNTQADYSQNQCIHQLFETQVNQTPDNIAVVFDTQELTYRELNQRANKLAHYLQKQGIKPEVLVGICVERSLEMIVGILGILKAGGAYIPLDPAYPQERLAFMLEDAQVSVLLTQQRLVELPKHQASVICLDADWENIALESDENLTHEAKSDNLAYVIYTSGSTGKPKGVAIAHQNLVHSTSARLAYYREPCDRFLLLSSFAFDSSIAGIFWTITQGGMLVLPQEGVQRDLSQILGLISQHRISHFLSLPSLYALLLEQAQSEQLVSLRTVIVAGELCPKELVSRHLEQLPKTSLFNEYGPTEGTVWSSVYHCQSPELIRLPIGRPITNTQIYLLNSDLRPVPIGVPGEIYIGGAGLARGYLNRPELTAQKFINNPFKADTQLYKTGDLARFLPDENLEFLGRIDHQVKIRGFRIELEEIEAVLKQYPGVRETVVVAREDVVSDRRIVAYFVPSPESTFTISNLRHFLQEKLPEYMIPSAFVRLLALPLLPNGKVNRQQLPAPNSTSEQLPEYTAAKTPVEKLLAGIWAQILRVERVGIHDNFFDLGGDSILNIQVIAKANKAGLALTPKQLFEAPTIAQLAALTGTTHTIQAEQGMVIGQVPLTPIQHWFFEDNPLDPHHSNQAVLLKVPPDLDPQLLQIVVQHLLRHHDALRLRFIQEGDAPQQVNASFNEVVPFTCLDLSAHSPDAQKAALESAAAEVQTSLNLSQGPLVRVVFFTLGNNQRNRLLIVIHHLAVDGVSWRILLEDLQTAYEQISRGKTIQLPPKTTSFQQWAQRLQEYAHSSELQQEENYWLTQLRKPVCPLPVDFSGGANTVASVSTVSVTLSQEETQALLQQVPAAYGTQINDVLLTALVQAFGQWTGDSLLVDLEGHGREEIFDDVNLSRTVGWFTTIFPVRLSLEEASNPGDALQAIKKQLRSIPNRGLGYGVLRYLSKNLEKPLQLQMPQAEVIFNYLGQSDQVFQSSLLALAEESSGLVRSPRGHRRYLLDINGIVVGGQLRLNWTYSEAVHRRVTIESLAEDFQERLRSLITHCQTMRSPVYTPSDSQPKLSPLETPLPANPTTTSKEITIEQLLADAILDSAIRPNTAPVKDLTDPTCIFLTGATGFLGAFLLYELLQQTQADIYCLVRSPNIESAKKRLQSNLESYLIWNESLSSRIIPVLGDLSQPLLGLSQEQFQLLANKIDVIYHNGAAINLVYPYSMLKTPNVLGTQEILRLACQTKVKPVHYVSTLATLLSADNDVPKSGYAQTKWVAEQLIMSARSQGLPASIYRIGSVSGHSQTGACNPNDHLCRTIKGYIQLKSAPAENGILRTAPVDYVSQAILHLSQQKNLLGEDFHLSSPHPILISDIFKWLSSFGYSIQQISYAEWQTKLSNYAEHSQDNAVSSLLPLFEQSLSNRASKAESSTPKSNSVEDTNFQNTLDKLASASICCPPVDDKFLHTYFSYLIQIGFLDAPQPSEI